MNRVLISFLVALCLSFALLAHYYSSRQRGLPTPAPAPAPSPSTPPSREPELEAEIRQLRARVEQLEKELDQKTKELAARPEGPSPAPSPKPSLAERWGKLSKMGLKGYKSSSFL